MPILDTDRIRAGPALKAAIPILLVRDVTASADFFRQKLGFEIDFLYGAPPFYGNRPVEAVLSVCWVAGRLCA